MTPKTRYQYEWLFSRHIEPKLGHSPLRQLSAPRGVAIVRRWHAQLVRSAGQDAAAKAYRLLRSVLNSAVQEGRLAGNPCVIEGAGTEHHDERPIATPDQVQAAALAMPERLRAMVELGTWCGLRMSEILALTRENLDLPNGQIRVRGGAHQVPGMGRVMTGPKSEAGRRDVDVPASLAPVLEEHLDRFVGPEPDAWVFTGVKGDPLSRGVFQKEWAKARDGAGLPDGFVFHDLRHSGNTWAAATGASTKELMARLGHSTSRAALIYQHATEERLRSIADGLDGFRQPAAKASGNGAA